MAKYALPNVPFVQARHIGKEQKPTAIVISLSSTTSDEGAALGLANNLHSSLAPHNSYHYIVDEAQVYRCVPDNRAAYKAPYRSLNVLICAEFRSDLAAWHFWEDNPSVRALHRAEELVADLTLAHKILPRYLDEDQELKWMNHRWRRRGGIIRRVVGAWPEASFLCDLQAQIISKTS